MLHSILFSQVGLLFFTSLFLSILLVPMTIGLAERLGAVDHPKSRSSHSRSITRLGGLGIAAAFLTSCSLFISFDMFFWGFIAGFMVILLTGLADDVLNVHHRWKFVGQILASLLFIYLSGDTLENLGNLVGGGDIHLGMFAIPFTVFCMVGGMNALNLADGLDGLAAGVAAIAATFFAFLAWEARAPYLILISVALLGALLGFLRYNSHPARLFMGDTGSLLLGYTLSVVLVSGSQIHDSAVPLTAWVLVVALPLLDVLLVMGRRMLRGCSPFSPDRTHLHHRLLLVNLPHSTVVAVIYIAVSFFGWLAILLRDFPDWVMFVTLFVVGFLIYAFVFELQRNVIISRNHWEIRLLRGLKQKLAQWRDRMNHISFYAVPVSLSIFGLLVLPSLFFPVVMLSSGQAIAMIMLAIIIVTYCHNQKKENIAILHGTVYVALVVLMYLYNLTPESQANWLHIYVGCLSALATIWIVLKMIFRKGAVPLKASSFELLILFISSFLPLVFFDGMNFSDHIVEAGRYAALEAIPLLIVTKIYFQNDPKNHQWVVRAFAIAITLVAVRGYLA